MRQKTALFSTTNLRFRILRLDGQGGWHTVWGEACGGAQVRPLPVSEDERDEMVWCATGVACGVMRRRVEATRATNASHHFPVHYPSETIRTMMGRRQEGILALTPIGKAWEGYASLDALLRSVQAPARRAGGHLAGWLEIAREEAQHAPRIWGGDGLHIDGAPNSAHRQMAAARIASTLLPIGAQTCRCWLGTP